MHPQVLSDKPGDCSICGMHLVAAKGSGGPETFSGGAGSVPGFAPVELSSEARQQLGVTVGAVEKRPLAKEVRASARIIPDETRVFPVVARADGYVDRLPVTYAGRSVKKGEEMLSVYSPSIQAAQQQFVGSTVTEGRRYPNATAKPPSGAAEPSDRDDAFRERLNYWGFGDKQIERIQKTGKVENSLVIESPINGVVTEKMAVLGLRVSPGDTLFVVTDFSWVWAEADVPESDVPSIKVGMPGSVELSAWPGRVFAGKVKFMMPVLDPQSHTMKVVLELPNPGLELKPGMVGTGRLSVELGTRLSAPEGAVVRTGEKNYAFRDEGGGRLIPAPVELGPRCGGYYEVLSGLREGDTVVTSANFLLDSESSLRAALQAASGKR
jgi:Cu(I)/Ag(I) efflux system membrane fusion protein